MTLRTDRRGSVALLAAVLAPALVMTLALAVEVTSWSVASLELQRVADVAAWAGAMRYAAAGDAQSATGSAAQLADLNRVTHSAARNWNAAGRITSDDMISAQIISGIRRPGGDAVQVTVMRSIPKVLTGVFPSSVAAVTVTATAIAEIGSLGPQPCITALGQGVDGITTGTDVSIVGTANLTAHGCSLRSNDGVSQTGGGNISMDGVYAGGAISGGGICCDLHANSGQIPDPYAGYARLQNALAALSPGTGSALSVKPSATQSVSPGTFSTWDIKGTVDLAPGTYYVNGSITIGSQAVLQGTGVTILTSGAITVTGGATLALSAPLKGAAAGISGVLFGSRSSTSVTLLGNSTSPMSGLIYMPNAALKFAGTAGLTADACLEVVASTVTLVGTSDLAAKCSNYDTLSWGSLPGPAKVTLVQ